MSQSLLIQGRFQHLLKWGYEQSNRMSRNPFWSRAGFNTVKTIKTVETDIILSQSLLIQGRFQQGRSSPLWWKSTLSQSLLIQGRFQHKKRRREYVESYWCVAIPFDPGQVSTMRMGVIMMRVFGYVAIPFDPGQVSTLYELCKAYNEDLLKSQSLLIQGRFQRLQWRFIKIDWQYGVAIPFDPGQVSTYGYYTDCSNCTWWWVAIPFDPGQVSTHYKVVGFTWVM